jgi:phosphohistidine phosphatase
MRHAKAESFGESDHARRLTEKGRADAVAAGHWLAAQGSVPDVALISSATRTQETWEAVSDGAGWAQAPVLDDGLYSAGPDTALDLIRETPTEVRSLFVIGHNPTIAFLAQMLDDGEGDPAATADMAGGYPTCALTVLTFDGSWSDLAMASARVTAFHVGRA